MLVMQGVFILDVILQEESEALRERMEEAGCVFEFIVLAPGVNTLVDESTHRRVLIALHDKLLQDAFDRYHQLIKNPEYKDRTEPEFRWELDKAVATPLSKEEIHNLVLDGDYERGPLALYGHFKEPPYGTKFKGGELEAQELFHEWRQTLGLEEQDGVVVINWVKGFKLEWLDNDDAIPGRESWSDYFDAGLEWWGVWCLTIWNPKRRTLSALIASTTD